MKKKLIPTIVAVIVLAGLIVTYFVVEKNFSTVEETDIDDIFGTYEYIWEENPEAISNANFNIENGEYTIKVGSDITIEGFESVIISRYELLQTLRKIATIPVERFIDVKESEYGKYGFSDSKNVITLTFSDKRVRTLVIGHNSGVNNEVYALSKEDGKVATLSKETAEELLRPATKFRSKIICTLSNVFLREMAIYKGNKKVMEIAQGDSADTYVLNYPYENAMASSRKVNEFLSKFSQIDADAVVEENPKNLSAYGFDDGLTVYVHDSANKHTFKFGSMAPEGGMYIMYNDRPVVYRGNIFLYEEFKDINPVDYLEPYVHLYASEDVDSIELSHKGEKCLISYAVNNGKKSHTVNGKKISVADFSSLYRYVAGIYYGKVSDEKASSDVYFEITFKMKDGKVNNFKYYDAPGDYCVVRTTNGYDAVVLKNMLDDLWAITLSYAK